jgi:hypothetical protein
MRFPRLGALPSIRQAPFSAAGYTILERNVMSSNHRNANLRTAGFARVVAALVCLAAAVWFAPRAAVAQDALKDATSLKFAPADVSFYSTSLRNRQVYDVLVNSNAFAKLKAMPALQMGLAMLDMQLNDPSGDLYQFGLLMDLPENQQFIALLIEMISDEIFVYGGQGFAETYKLSAELSAVGQTQSQQEILEALNKHLPALRVPDLLIGFKVQNVEAARTQLARLEVLVKLALADQPALAEAFSRKAVGGTEFLTMRLTGAMIPWDEIPTDQIEDAAALAAIKENLATKTVTVSLGMYEQYVLLSLGDTDEHLATIGQGALLIDHEKLAPVRAAADRPLVSIDYASEEFLKAANPTASSIQSLISGMSQGLAEAGLGGELEESLEKDIAELSVDLQRFVPVPGAMLAYTFLADRGFESFSYDWSEKKYLDGARPLDILNHVGGDPILMVASRNKPSLEGYDLLVKWLKKAQGYFEATAVAGFDDADRANYEQFREKFLSLMAEADNVTRTKLFPAMQDGQSALVIDAKFSTDQPLHAAMPPAGEALPVPDIAIVVGVSNAALLKEASNDYVAIAEQVLAAMREIEPDQAPPFAFPEAVERRLDVGGRESTMYT